MPLPLMTIQSVPQTLESPFFENLGILRTQWKWATFSQFFYTFSPLFALDDVSLIDIENDLVEGSSRVIPHIMTKLLYTLTHDRKVSLENWQYILRKQYTRRAPHLNPFVSMSQSGVHDIKTLAQKAAFGLSSAEADEDTVDHHDTSSSTSDEFNDWDRLSMLQKLDSIHLLTEWQFQNPLRLRTLMKCEDEDTSWRIEPIGYDKQKNAYWLIGPDRLWIQRAPPGQPKKRRNTKQSITNRTQKAPFRGLKRRRVDENSNTSGVESRIYHSDTNLQATETQVKVVYSQKQTVLESSSSQRRRRADILTTSIRPAGTRVSSRLRGTQQEEWQPIPKELEEALSEKDSHPSFSEPVLKTGLETESDELSELTELSDDDDRIPLTSNSTFDREDGPPNEVVLREAFQEEESKDFVEWETICVSLYDWEHVAARFASGTHYSERALHKYLIHRLVPSVTERLKAFERKKRLEEAITYRKRSSRIALKESKKEQALAAARRCAEEKEQMSRSKRLEARQQREEERRIQQDNARELRRREREEIQQRGRLQPNEGCKKPLIHEPKAVSFAPAKVDTLGQAKRGLSCEICHIYDGTSDDHGPLMFCSSCFKWQHIACNAQARVTTVGLLRRDWDSTDFVCQNCRSKVQFSTAVPEHQVQIQGGDYKTLNKPVSRTKNNVGGYQQSYAVALPCSSTTNEPTWRPDLMSLIDYRTPFSSSRHVTPANPSQEGQFTQGRLNDETSQHVPLLSQTSYPLSHSENRHGFHYNLSGNSAYYETSSIMAQARGRYAYSSPLPMPPSVNNKLPHYTKQDFDYCP